LLAPDKNALLSSNVPIFQWYPVDDGFTYQIQIDDDSQFGSPAQDNVLAVGDLTYTAAALPEGTWYWRVRAITWVGAPGQWSQRWAFTVDITPSVSPLPTRPAYDAHVTNKQLRLEWEKVDDVDYYELQLDTSAAFLLPVIDVGRKNRYAPPTALAQSTYYWRVRAVDKAGNVSQWSAVQVFHLVAGNTALPTPVPTLAPVVPVPATGEKPGNTPPPPATEPPPISVEPVPVTPAKPPPVDSPPIRQ
jgi:hypothetical protein